MPADPVRVVLKFEQLINSHDAGAIAGLLAEDSVFIDSLGASVRGRDRLRVAWEGYFRIVPDYVIAHEEIFSHGEAVAIFGSACGTFSRDGEIRKENSWKTTAAWRAIVKDEKIAMWQVFADNEPIRAIMRCNA